MKYRVHTYQTIRVVYEVDAATPLEAKNLVEEDGWDMLPTYVGRLQDGEWTDDFVVDPIMPNGEVDYDNVTNFFERSEA